MKKIHWMHRFYGNGFKEYGSFTVWKGKCECGAFIESTDISKTRGKSPALKLYFCIFTAVFLLMMLFFYLYINGIYPFYY